MGISKPNILFLGMGLSVIMVGLLLFLYGIGNVCMGRTCTVEGYPGTIPASAYGILLIIAGMTVFRYLIFSEYYC
jgi:DMSO reductase anchor subunit